MFLKPAPRAIAPGVGAVPVRRCLCQVGHLLILRAGHASQLADAIMTGQDLIQAFPGASWRPSPLPTSA
jgi:hypothetical protein